MRGERNAFLAASGVALAAAAALFARFRSHPLMGWDTFPEIATSRIAGFADLVGTFTEQTAEGYYPSAFYRPLFNLSLAVDEAVWGIEPAGYHGTSALLIAACALALFVLARRLLGGAALAGPFAALAVFLLLPVHVEVMIPSRRMDLLCGLFSALALATQIPRIDRGLRGAALPAGLTLLAVAAKEPGVVVAPLVVLLVLLHRPDRALAERLAQALRTALPHAAVIAAVFAARFAAIGGLGGHESTSLPGAVLDLPETLGTILLRLSTFAVGGGTGLATPLALVFVLVAAALLARALRPPAQRALDTAGFAATWLVLLAAIQAAAGLLQPWHLLLPGMACALLLGAGIEAALGVAGERQRPAGAALAAVLVVFALFQARYSPIVREVGHWARGASEARLYLDELGHRIDTAGAGDVIHVRPPPVGVKADPNPLGTTFATPIAIYSLPAWAELRFPGRKIAFRHPSLESAPAEADGILVWIEAGNLVL